MPLNLKDRKNLPSMRSSFINNGGESPRNTSFRMIHLNQSRGANGNQSMNLDSTADYLNGSVVDADIRAHITSADDRLARLEQMFTGLTVGGGGGSDDEVLKQINAVKEEIAKSEKRASHTECERTIAMLREQVSTLTQQNALASKERQDLTKQVCDMSAAMREMSVTKSPAVAPIAPPPPQQPANDMATMQMLLQYQMLQQQQQQQLATLYASQQQPQPAAVNPMQAMMNQFGGGSLSLAQQPQPPQVQQPLTQPIAMQTPPQAPTSNLTLSEQLRAKPPTFAPSATTTPPLATTITIAPAGAPVAPFTGFKGLLNATPPTAVAAAPSPVGSTTRNRTMSHSSDHGDEFVPSVDFTPVCALPEIVETVTGEEGEEVVFVSRAKLYRFTNDEFKERGLGDVKILRNTTTGKWRCLMRREVVFKICANFSLTSSLSIKAKSEKVLVWSCLDFADEEPAQETLSIRFKTAELATGFKKAFEEGCHKSSTTETTVKPTEATAKPTEATPKTTAKPFGAEFMAKVGSFECPSCLLRVDAGKLCPVCNVDRDGKKATAATTTGATTTPSPFSFGIKPSNASTPDTKTIEATPKPAGGFSFGFAPDNNPFAAKTTETTKATETAKVVVAPAKETAKPSPFAGFSFGVSNVAASATPPKPTAPTTTAEPAATTTPSAHTFGATATPTTGNTSTFGGLSHETGDWKGFGSGFKSVSAKPMFGGTPTGGVGGEDHPEAYEAEVDFKPICALPDVIDAKTGEEDEEVLFSCRSKLYRFKEGEFRERGLGDLKILEHKETKKVRCVMRREVVHKVCANFQLTHDMSLHPMAQSDKAFTWVCQDYSEEEMAQETLAARFKTVELAQDFKRVFDKACKEANLAGSPAPLPAPTSITGDFGAQFKPAAGSWECPQCLLRANEGELCKVCNIDKEGNKGVTEKKKEVTASTFSFGIPAGGKADAPKSAATPFTFGLPTTTASTSAPISFSFKTASTVVEHTASDKETVTATEFTEQEKREGIAIDALARCALVQDDTSIEYDGEVGVEEEDYEDCDDPLFTARATVTVSKQGHALRTNEGCYLQIFEDDDVDANRIFIYACDEEGDMGDGDALINHVIVGDMKWTTGTRTKSPFLFSWDANDYGTLGEHGEHLTIKMQFNNAKGRDAFCEQMTESRTTALANGVMSMGASSAASGAGV